MLIYIAYDDTKFGQQLGALLLSQNYVVERLDLSATPIKRVSATPPQLIVLACAVQATAIDLLKSLRADQRLRAIPALCINPKGGSSEGIALLDAGGDDFINRPFNGEIFVARVRTLLRRRIWEGELREEATILNAGPIELRLVSRQATLSGKRLDLTRLEFDLLSFLLRQPDRVFARAEILKAVWNYPTDVETRTLEKHIEMLRKKLGAHGEQIETIHGIGYRFAPSAAPAKSPKS